MKVNDFYNDFYSKALNSKAHSKFCEKVYGIDLCQHGMTDVEQIKLLLNEVNLDDSKKVVDFGCGPGFITKYICQLTNCKIIGVDISEVGIEIAKKNNINKNINYICSDVDFFRKYTNEFDCVLLIDSHYFIDNFCDYLEVISKSLSKNGKIVIFSDQGTGIKGFNESETMPEETIIGEYLVTHRIKYKGIRLYEMNKKHWNLKYKVLMELKKDFIEEKAMSIFENRMNECIHHDRSLDGRYLFIVEKFV
ncbi:MAG: methyltransferase domain-containing protein [Treponema sp.]